MIGRIARKELLETLRDGRFRLLAAVVVVLSMTSLAAGWMHYRDVQRQHAEAQQATRGQWLNQAKKTPHSAAHYGVYAFKPKSRLSMIDTGIDPYVGVATWLEAHKQNEFAYRPAQDRTAVARFGELSTADGFLVLLPLFVVMIAFSAFSGERELGTLRQLLSLGVRPRDLLAGKALGIAGALALVVVPATIAGTGALALTSEFGSPAHDLTRASLMAVAYLLYLVIVGAVSLGVSARASSSRVALIGLLAFWFANSLIATRVASDVAATLYPTPSAAAFRQAMEQDLTDQTELQRRLAQRREELMRRYGATSMDAVPVNFSGISLQEGENHGNEVFDRHYGRLFDLYERQQRIYSLAGFVAPLLPVRALSMALAGTDFAHHRDFVRSAEEYRRTVQRVMNDDIVNHPVAPGVVYTAGPELWSRVPPFEYEAPGAGWALAYQLPSLVALAVWLALAWWFAHRSVAHLRADRPDLT
jgi:ABC-2 type transport system permease protein